MEKTNAPSSMAVADTIIKNVVAGLDPQKKHGGAMELVRPHAKEVS